VLKEHMKTFAPKQCHELHVDMNACAQALR